MFVTHYELVGRALLTLDAPWFQTNVGKTLYVTLRYD